MSRCKRERKTAYDQSPIESIADMNNVDIQPQATQEKEMVVIAADEVEDLEIPVNDLFFEFFFSQSYIAVQCIQLRA